jgi:hypothetical protein
MLAKYNADPAIPIGSFPARIYSCSAFLRNFIAYRFVFSDKLAILAIFAMHETESTIGIFKSNSFSINLQHADKSFFVILIALETSFSVLGVPDSRHAAYKEEAISAEIERPLTNFHSSAFL